MADAFKPANAAEAAASRVAKRAKIGSVLIFISIIGLILQLVDFWLNNCQERDGRKLARRMRRLSLLQRAAIRNKARELFSAHPDPAVRACEHEVCEAMFAEASAMSEEEAANVVNSIMEPFA